MTFKVVAANTKFKHLCCIKTKYPVHKMIKKKKLILFYICNFIYYSKNDEHIYRK